MVIHLRLGNFDAAASLSKSTNDSHLGRASNHLAYADAPSGVVLTFFFDGAMVDRWLVDDISFSASAPVNMSETAGVCF